MSLLQHVLQVAHKEQRHHSQCSHFTIHYVMNVIQVALLTCHNVTLNRWQSGWVNSIERGQCYMWINDRLQQSVQKHKAQQGHNSSAFVYGLRVSSAIWDTTNLHTVLRCTALGYDEMSVT